MRAQGTASSHPEAQGLKGLCGEMCAWECVREYLIAHSMDGPTRRRSMAVWLGEGFDLFVQLKMRRGWQHRGVCVGGAPPRLWLCKSDYWTIVGYLSCFRPSFILYFFIKYINIFYV